MPSAGRFGNLRGGRARAAARIAESTTAMAAQAFVMAVRWARRRGVQGALRGKNFADVVYATPIRAKTKIALEVLRVGCWISFRKIFCAPPRTRAGLPSIRN